MNELVKQLKRKANQDKKRVVYCDCVSPSWVTKKSSNKQKR